jgi:hypothetical protein
MQWRRCVYPDDLDGRGYRGPGPRLNDGKE